MDLKSSPQNSSAAAHRRKWRWLLLIFPLLILACITWWGWSAIYHQQTFHPTGQIRFECSTHVMETSLCAVNANGSGYKRFEMPYYAFISPSWSPDGESIAFLRDVGGVGFSLSLIKADGSGLVELTDQFSDVEDPAWSPDGKSIAFAKFDASGKAEGIYTIQVDGSNLTQRSTFGVGPVWSPDGRHIAFINEKDGIYDYGIYILNIDTGTQIQIASVLLAKSLAWSPNGLQLAFTYTDTNKTSRSLGLMNADGSNRKQFQGGFSSPAWSPDGTKIAYNCGHLLCAMNADGSGQTQLSQNTLLDLISAVRAFSWSPDGQYIVYDYSTICPTCGPVAQLWIMKADGSQATKLTDGSDRPDGSSYPYDRNPVWWPAP